MIIFLGFFLIVGAALLLINDRVNVGLEDLQGKGEVIESITSPDENYTANVYLINEGGATTRFQIRVAIYSNNNDTAYEKTFDDNTIYWEYGTGEKTTVFWVDKETIKINDVTLNIFNDTYNWKKDRIE